MSRRATLTTILTAMLLVAIPYTVLATDSDGDGTDDADDDFPNNPCADTDTDGDGLPDTVVSGCSSQSVVGYTSFEDPYAASIQYTDTGIDSVNRYLWNNANESHVAHNQTTGSEMGFTLYYTSTGGAGLTDGDYFGTVNYTGTVGNFTDGTKGYQMSDVDGITTLTLDDITAETLTFDLFVQDTGWEWSSSSYDYINISFIGANSDISILSTYGTDIDTGYASYLGTWTSMAVAIGTAGNGHLEFEFSSNAGPEAIYIDNIQFTSTVVLTADLDDDGDGWLDVDETDCGTDPLDGNDVPADADSNGICDALEGDDFDGDGISNDQDPDDDNDGVDDADDAFPLNPNEWDDTDSDGIGDNADLDDDNDAWTDVDESACGTDPLDGASIPSDYDNDMVCDSLDSDDDNDLVLDVDDAFPNDPYETVDTDGDGVGDNADLNDDGDAWTDAEESACGTDPLDGASIPSDYDNDMVCDSLDSDDDNDLVLDVDDAFPNDPYETVDTDGDGVGDNADLDDDGDVWTDAEESACGTDPLDSASIPSDYDNDMVCDSLDSDDDDDGWTDTYESDCNTNPSDASSIPLDSDGDGTCDSLDNDDDGDGYSDLDETANCDDGSPYGSTSDPLDSADTPADMDGDGECNIMDNDSDNDGVDNEYDAFPYDANEWVDTDGDGSGDNADQDDDEDGWWDYLEDDCGSDSADPVSTPADMDGDGICDGLDDDMDGDGYGDDDAFPNDVNEWVDTDGDGTGDNTDLDDDGDGVADGDDASPLDAGEWDDTDGDGIGDNTDLDDDNDGWSDAEENECGTDQYDSGITPTDYDNNGVCDANDPIIEPEPEGTPGFGLISALAVLALAALARRD